MSRTKKVDYNFPSLNPMRKPVAMRSQRFSSHSSLLVCASQGQRVYVAPSNDTIISTTEEGHGATPSHNIYVVNKSTVPIIVFGVTLRDCDNIKQRCESQLANVKIDGGQRRIVMRVEPRSLERAYSYRFGYSWRPEKH